jgi:hypothetical protein
VILATSAPVDMRRFTRAKSLPPASNLQAFHVRSFMVVALLAESAEYARFDHVYTKGLVLESKVMPDATTDHRPVVTTVRAGGSRPDTKLVSLKRQNFKAITRGELEGALNLTDWSKVYDIRDVDAVLDYITAGIVSALDTIAPEKEIQVKKCPNLYLKGETLEVMRKRDLATGRRYCDLRNEVSQLVRRDKQDSNLLSLRKASNDPKVLWHLADQALGKDRPSLPASITGANGPTTTPMEAANVMNKFFIDKVDDLRKKALFPNTGVSEETPDVAGEVPHVRQDTGQVPQDAAHVAQEVDNVLQEVDDDTMTSSHVPPFPFHFKFANAKRTSEAIKSLNNTEALGTDGIPTSVLKKGVEVLAGPISHLVNRSLAKGRVPAAFKIGLVHPIHKGKGKPREDPGSYRPVSILPPMSKVLETLVKGNLEGHLKRVNGLPGSQYGFRPKRSCTSALAHGQAGKLSGAAKGKVVGLMAFDLSAAFDTVAADQLVPTLHALGIMGRELRWFLDYMSGGKQCVVWDGTVSGLVNVLYGVRQGSILGLILFIILTSGMASFLGVEEDENMMSGTTPTSGRQGAQRRTWPGSSRRRRHSPSRTQGKWASA